MRPTRTQTLTEKGRELLERNLRGKCNAALRSANTIANKLNPLLESADVSDVSLVRQYKDELELCIIQIISTHDDFQTKFAGDLETLASFSLWFQPRFEVLQKLLYFTRDWLARNTKCDTDDNVRPEDSVSEVASVEDNFTGRSSVHRSHSGSHSSRKSCASSSSIKSARIKESLKKVSLLAEANTLSKKQDLLRKELELSLEKESLELSTKLAIATAKEEVLLNFSVENSVVTTSQLDKKSSDAKFKMVTDHIGQAGVEFVHPTTDSVCPVKIEMYTTLVHDRPLCLKIRKRDVLNLRNAKLILVVLIWIFRLRRLLLSQLQLRWMVLLRNKMKTRYVVLCLCIMLQCLLLQVTWIPHIFPGTKPVQECLCLLIRFLWNQEAQMLHIHFPLQWQWHTS